MPHAVERGEQVGGVIASAVLTVGLVAAMAISVRGYHHEIESGPRVAGEPVTREQVTFVQPRDMPAPVVPLPRVTPQSRVVAPATPARTLSPPRASDSASNAPPAVATRSVPGDASPAPPPAAGRAPASSCVGPCDAGTTVGVRTAAKPENDRDATISAIADAMRAAAASSGRPTSGMGGVSLNVGLPGGGPSRAQRKRDSTINADVTARLDRIRARGDSVVKADSIARARKP
ncbi:MAG: hypothetical protein M3081_20990 [Gemmatimonadota bacterium]|nr:hypothetical protein [Gemmatimonadota bacterium]